MNDSTVQRPRRNAFEDSLKDSLRVGAASGGAGFLIGGTAGILKNTTPVLFGIASLIQCSTLGSTFWLSRSEVLRAWDQPNPSPGVATQASAIAGACSGGFSALVFRGVRNVLPGVLCMAVFGALGQAGYNRYASEKSGGERVGVWKTFVAAKWSPVSSLSDEDYIERLREQLLKSQVEISILDDKIEALRRDLPSASSEQANKDSK